MDKTKYKCTECGWVGTYVERISIRDLDGWDYRCCPKCHNDEFYILKNKEVDNHE